MNGKKEIDPESVDLELLMQIAQAKAGSISGGHLTIMKFSCHWKVMFKTPNLDGKSGRDEVRKLKPYDSLKKALFDILTTEEVKNG